MLCKFMSKRAINQLKTTCPGTLLFISCGIHIGWNFSTYLDSVGWARQLDGIQHYFMGSAIFIGTLAGAALAGRMANRQGRNKTLGLGALSLVVSGLCFMIDQNEGFTIVFGRIIGGYGVGIVYTVQTLYVGEIADFELRGRYVVLHQIATGVGCIVQYLFYVYVDLASVNLLSGLTVIIISIIGGILHVVLMKESPYFYVIEDKMTQAEITVMYLRGMESVNSEVRHECNEIQTQIITEYRDHNKNLLMEYRRLFFTNISLKLLHSATFNLPLMILNLQVVKFVIPQTGIAQIMMMGFRILGLIIGGWTIDQFGRRPTLMISGSVIFCCMNLLPCILILGPTLESYMVPMIIVLLLQVAAGLGPNCVPDVLISETFGTPGKGLAVGAVAMAEAIASWGIFTLWFYVGLQSNALVWSLYAGFGIMSLGSVWFAKYGLPETRGASLSEIKKLFDHSHLTEVANPYVGIP